MKMLRAKIADNRKLLERELTPAFSDLYNVPLDPIPWFGQLPIDMLARLLCVEDPNTHQYILNFAHLSQMASCAKFPYTMFFVDVPDEEEPTNLWYHLTKQWLPMKANGELTVRKFPFLKPYIERNWFKNTRQPETKAMEAYLNRFGAGFCQHCAMFTNIRTRTDQKHDLIPLSPFRLLTPQEQAEQPSGYNDSELIQPYTKDIRNIPDWLRAMLALRNMADARYCCVNCKTVLNQQMFGVPVISVFEACAKRSNRGVTKAKDPNTQHLWMELQYELTRPPSFDADGKAKRKEIIPGQYEYCCRCGLMRFEDQRAELDEETCPDCKKTECECERCDFCNGPAGCDCIICDRCNRCQTGCTSRCKKKGCRCDGSSSEPSEVSSSSDDEEDSSEPSSSSSPSDSDSD